LKANVKNFRQSLPLITNLRNEAIRERHWDKLKGEQHCFLIRYWGYI
ncbi:MAG: hypothetical protein EZS28_029669, partial [Streblomastix strix]